MDIFLFILAGLFILVGTAGSVLPVLPGVPLGYVGLLLLQLTDRVQYSATFLVAWAAAVVAIQVPPAPQDQRPVYIGGDLVRGSYRRSGDGDYHCTQAELNAMLASRSH